MALGESFLDGSDQDVDVSPMMGGSGKRLTALASVSPNFYAWLYVVGAVALLWLMRYGFRSASL